MSTEQGMALDRMMLFYNGLLAELRKIEKKYNEGNITPDSWCANHKERYEALLRSLDGQLKKIHELQSVSHRQAVFGFVLADDQQMRMFG